MILPDSRSVPFITFFPAREEDPEDANDSPVENT
jgi:hypothetical protein